MTEGAAPESKPFRFVSSRNLLIAIAVLVFLAHAVAYRAHLLDDAYISLRYARNLVAGHGQGVIVTLLLDQTGEPARPGDVGALSHVDE